MSEPRVVTRDFLWLVGAHLLESSAYASMVLLPLYLAALGASRAEIGAVMAAAAVGGLLARPAIGLALDRWGRKPTLVLSTLAAVLGMELLLGVREVGPLVFLARVLFGAGVAGTFTGYFTLAADLIPASRRTEGLALFGISGLLPLVVNPLSTWLGVEPLAVRWFIPLVGLGVLASLLLLHQVEERPAADGRRAVPGAEVLAALRSRRLWSVWWSTAVFGTLVGVFFAFVTVVATERGVGGTSSLWLAYAASAAGIRVFGARLPDRLGPARLVAPSLLAYAAALVLAGTGHSLGAFLGVGALAGLAHGACFPVLASLTTERSPSHLRGAAMAMYTALWDVMQLAMVPLLGVVADLLGDGSMLVLAGSCCAAALTVWWALEREGAPVAASRRLELGTSGDSR